MSAWVDRLPVETISQRVFDSLGEYSCSLPTGQTIGKVWKQNMRFGRGGEPEWVICEYVDHEDPKLIGINYRRPVVV